MAQDLFSGGWKARLDQLGTALRAVHKALIDSTQRDYEKKHGKINGPYALFALVSQDPAFAWLQPMTHAIVEIEDRLDRRAPPVLLQDLQAARKKVHELLDPAHAGFGATYWSRMDTDPNLAVEHGKLQAHLKES